MHRILLLSFFLIVSVQLSMAQKNVDILRVEELLNLFEKHSSLEVLDIVTKSPKRLHYKAYYQSESLKPKLMEWLSKELYLQGALSEIENNYREDSAYLANKIQTKAKQNDISIDSLKRIPAIYKLYEDSVIIEIMETQERSIRKEEPLFPTPNATEFHNKLAYPESYDSIRSFWLKDGKGEDSRFYLPLVVMGDPEARKLFDQYIAKVVKTNGEGIFLNRLLGLLEGELRGSYGIEKSLELLRVDEKIILFSGDDESIPFNCRVLKSLISQAFYYEIPMNNVERKSSCDKGLRQVEEIKKAAQRLIQDYKEQEYYWMSNMPFYKK